MQPEEGHARLRALGFGRDECLALWEHFDHAEQQGKLGHGYSRIVLARDARRASIRRRCRG